MNDLEKRFIENANKYKCLTFHNGFPDFLVVPEYDTRVGFFVEVKPKENPRLSPEQLKTFSALKQAGMPVSISYDGEWQGIWADKLDFLSRFRKARTKPMTIQCSVLRCMFNQNSGVCSRRNIEIGSHAECSNRMFT